MKKFLSIILFTTCLTSGCSTISKTNESTAQNRTTVENVADTPTTVDFFAMDTTISFSAYTDNEILEGAKNVLTDIEKKVSVTDKESEIYHINQNGSGVLTGNAIELMQKSLDMCARTDGILDISIYPIVKEWGFTTSEYKVPDKSVIMSLLSMVDYTKINFDKTTGNVTIPSGMTIDLGSIAKGYASQKCTQYLREHGVTSALLNLGGNVQTIGSKPDGSPWRIGIKDPKGGDPIMVLSIIDKAVVTSGGYERYFEQDGQTYWHIMDTATGYPARSGLSSVTIVGDDGATCDALSTSLFVMGLEKATDFWKNNNDFEAIFITDSGEVYITEGLKDTSALTDEHANTTVNIISR